MIRELFKRRTKDVWLTKGKTDDNADHLAPTVLQQLHERYSGTRLGRQELEAELLEDTEGALWSHTLLDSCRTHDQPDFAHVVVAIDPAMTMGVDSDETGIIAAARGHDGLYYVLADWSGRYAPDHWAERALTLHDQIGADAIVVEVNAGGDLVTRVLRQSGRSVFIKPVRAVRDKVARALPIAALYEQGRVKHRGLLKGLEDQMCRFTGSRDKGKKSPDRVDALVWALTELSTPARGEPRIRTL